jgi:hypothetical protein
MSVHASLTGADLHEPKGVASATSGQVYVSDGSGSGAWTDLVIPVVPIKARGTFTSAASPVVTQDDNIASITKTSTGFYVITFTSAMSSSDYQVLVTMQTTNSLQGTIVSPSTSGFSMYIRNTGSGAFQDPTKVYFVVLEGS